MELWVIVSDLSVKMWTRLTYYTGLFPLWMCLFSVYIICGRGFLENGLMEELDSCGFEATGFIVDDNKHTSSLAQWIKKHEYPISYFDMRRGDNRFQIWLRSAYINMAITNFLVLVKNPGIVLDDVDVIFRNETYQKLWALPHRSKWLLFAWTPRQLQQIEDQQLTSSLDNVAVVDMTIDEPWKRASTSQIWTYVWTQNRSKVPQSVKSTFMGQSCAIFPNTRYGLNGRELTIIGKSVMSQYIKVQPSPETGEPVYTGRLIRLIKDLSRMMNFTYTIWPHPREDAYLTWTEFDQFVESGMFDLGLTHYEFTLMDTNTNLEISSPYRYDSVTGIYRKPPTPKWLASVIPAAYVLLAYAFCILSLLIVVSIYFMIVYVIYPRIENTVGVKEHCCVERTRFSSFRICDMKQIYRYLRSLTYFLSTLFNQGTLPNVKPMSARTVVCAWGLYGICMNAMVTSMITANFVRKIEFLPFQTFSDLIGLQEYTWSVESPIILYALRVSKLDTMKTLHDHVEIIKRTSDDHGPLPESYLESLPYNVVFIAYRSDLDAWLNKQPNPNDFVIMKDILFQSRHALGFPIGSELRTLISQKITSLYENGMLCDFNPFLSHRNTSADGGRGTIFDSAFHILAGALVLTLLSFTIVILFVEVVTNKIRMYRKKNRSKYIE